MRRSEALGIIMNHLETCGRIDDIAYAILGQLEEAGIMPPLRDRTEYEEQIFGTKEDKFDTRLKKQTWDEDANNG